MKAFIFVALVASVAARSLDLETLRLAQKTPVVSKVGDELLLKEQLKKDLVFGQEKQQQVLDTTVIPTEKNVIGGIFNYDDNTIVNNVDQVLTLQELYSTPLFREYLSLPLFRQYIQYPSFQRFVSSIYFQRFYQLPAYKQYFVNPVLFYKYVYPIVQLFNTEYTLPTSYGQNEDVLGLQTLVDSVLLKNKNFLPYAYQNQNRFQVPATTGYPFTYGTDAATNYKFLLDKLYKNVVGQEIKTDVKLIPTQKVVVDQFTNKVVVDEPKIVDVQVDQKIVPVVDTIVPTTDKFETVAITERDILLVKDLLRQQIITPEVYQAVIYGKINLTTLLRQVISRGGIQTDLLNEIISRLQVVDTVVPVDTTTVTGVLPERQLVILKDLLNKQIITSDVYQAVLYGKVDFTVLLRQVLERRGLTIDLINLIINRLVVVDSVFTEQDVLLVQELLRQQIITPEIYQAVLVGKLDFFTLLRQVILRRDVIDTIIPVDTTVTGILSERQLVILKDLFKQQIISQEIYEAVLVGKVDLVTILRQVLERRGLTSDLISLIINRLVYVDTVVPVTEQDVYLLKELLRQQIISQEIYQAVIFGKIDLYTVLKQVIFRRDVVDTVVPYTSNVFNRFQGKDRYFDLINKLYGYKNLYNTEYPTVRDSIYNYNRYPIVA